MRLRNMSTVTVGLLILGGLLLTNAPLAAQQMIQNGFEARGPFWKPGSSDAAFKVLQHGLTEESAHQGQRSEQIRLQVEKGSYLHYTLDVPKAPITDELNLSLWIKSNRPGVELLCRMVFPRERDPKNVEKELSILVRCETYQNSRWKMLSLRQPKKRLREQQPLLAHQQGRAIDVTGAYVDRLVLNLYDGPGLTDVFIDDLEIGPVLQTPESVAATTNPVPSTGASRINTPAPTRRSGEVQFKNPHLYVSGKRFLMRGIRHTGTPLEALHDAGFNTVWMDGSTPAEVLADASRRGLWIVPSVVPPGALADTRSGGYVEGQLTSGDAFGRSVSRFIEQDSVLAWDLGSNLGADRFTAAARLARRFRELDPGRPVLGDIWDGYKGYSTSLSREGFLVGTHRWPLMTSLELPAYRDWLVARRAMTKDAYCWTWIQTHVPEWFLQQTQPKKNGENYADPLGPQPEQIRLLTYCALAAGYRGLAYWSDRFLSDSTTGRDRMLAMSLLNQELTLLEPLLVASSEPEWIRTSNPQVRAAVFRCPDGILVLPIWLGSGGQFVPGQGASTDLVVTVPGIPITATAWEVTPGRMQAYPIQQDESGSNFGRQVRLKNFSLTSAIVLTSDLEQNGLIVRLQDRQRRMAPMAAQYLHLQAREEVSKVEKIQASLDQGGHAIPGGGKLIQQSREALEKCEKLRSNGEYAEAYGQAELALRSLRVLMRAQWERGVRDLDSAVSSPYAVSYFSLPQHFRLLDRIAASQPGISVLKDGDFELDPASRQPGWGVQQVPSLDEVDITVRRVAGSAHTGKQSLLMRIDMKSGVLMQPAALERTYVAVHSPSIKLPPGTLVRISAWMRLPSGVAASPDGALLFDSAGGEPLAIRVTEKQDKWKRYALYREVPASGEISVTLAMSGLGSVYFDDVRIEPLEPSIGGAEAAVRASPYSLPSIRGVASPRKR